MNLYTSLKLVLCRHYNCIIPKSHNALQFFLCVCVYLVQMLTNFYCPQLISLCLAKFIRNGFGEGSISMTHTIKWGSSIVVPDCCPAVPSSNPESLQPTADCQSPGGLSPGMALGCGLISVRVDRRENYK
jgi:hypothetical protein